MPILLILFIAIPIAEIATFIQVGDIIGLLPTIAIIILTAVIGSTLVRQQGLEVMSKFKEKVDTRQVPLEPALHGLFLLVSGLLLITPGFLTDIIGFLFLVPQIRVKIGMAVWEKIKNSPNVNIHPGHMTGGFNSPNPSQEEGDIIEGEIILENETTKPNPKSKWAKKQDNIDN